MLSRTLETLLSNVFRDARSSRQEFMTVEHLLLALLDDVETREILVSAGAEIDELKSDLDNHIDAHVSKLSDGQDREAQPTLGFQRVLQRAVFHVQSSGRMEVTGANVLIAIFGEQESKAVSLLRQQGIDRIDIVNHIQSSSYMSAAAFDSAVVQSEHPRSRLANIESKVDQALREIRDLSDKVQRMADRLGPDEKS